MSEGERNKREYAKVVARAVSLETILAQKLNAGRPRDLAHLGLVFGDFAEKADKPKFLGIVQRFGLGEKWKRIVTDYFSPQRR